MASPLVVRLPTALRENRQILSVVSMEKGIPLGRVCGRAAEGERDLTNAASRLRSRSHFCSSMLRSFMSSIMRSVSEPADSLADRKRNQTVVNLLPIR
jgi:hypothetical protein